MDGQTFKVGEVLSEGWKLTKAHLGFLVGYTVIILLIELLFPPVNYKVESAILRIVGTLLTIFLHMGLYNSSLLITAGVKPGFDQLYSNWPHFISWLLANLLLGIMIVIGFVLLIVPGLYLMARYGLFLFFILDKDMGPIEALKAAGKASEGKRWSIFLLYVACAALNFVGFLLLGVGLLFTIPLTVLALAIVYRKITASEELEAAIESENLFFIQPLEKLELDTEH